MGGETDEGTKQRTSTKTAATRRETQGGSTDLLERSSAIRRVHSRNHQDSTGNHKEEIVRTVRKNSTWLRLSVAAMALALLAAACASDTGAEDADAALAAAQSARGEASTALADAAAASAAADAALAAA